MAVDQSIRIAEPLNPEIIGALLQDPKSWLSLQEQNALDERFRRRKELIKIEYRLAYEKELDDHMAEAEALQYLSKQAEQARLKGLNEYAEEQRHLMHKLLIDAAPATDYLNILLTRQADLTQCEKFLLQRNLELTAQIQNTQNNLKDIQAELQVVTQDWEKSKIEVQEARAQVDDSFNGTIVIDGREISLSANVLSEDKKGKVVKYREDVIDRLLEDFINNGSTIRNKDGSINMLKYQIFMAPAFMDVLAEQGVEHSIKGAHYCAKSLLPLVEDLARITLHVEMLNSRRRELTREEARQLAELTEQMKQQKAVLEDLVKIKGEKLRNSELIAAAISQSMVKVQIVTNSSYGSNASLIVQFSPLFGKEPQAEVTRSTLEKQVGSSDTYKPMTMVKGR